MSAAKVVGTGLVVMLAEVLKDYDVALVSVGGGHLGVVVQMRSGTAACPACKQESSRVCSRYWRTAADVTALGLQLRLRIRARRFRCENRECRQRVFAERLPCIPAWGRRSDRGTTLLAFTALGVGGLPGRRAARLYGLDYSRNTLLRAARQMVTDGPKSVEVLGVDDYAYRRGVSYGTLLFDLTDRKVIDLLPGRSAEFLAVWLRAHPGVQVISRDRGGIYAQGAREGAPQAIQVADRFHLMHSLGDCLEKIAQKGAHLTEDPPAVEDLTQEAAPDPVSPPRHRDLPSGSCRRKRRSTSVARTARTPSSTSCGRVRRSVRSRASWT